MVSVLDKSVKTPVGDAPVVPVALMIGGLYLCWFGIHYWRSDTKWPSDPVKAVLTGKPIPVPDRSASKAALDQIATSEAIAAGAAAATGGAAAAAGVPPATNGDAHVPRPPSGGYADNASRRALWVAAGGSPATAPIAAAISQAENGPGDPALTSANPDGGRNVGLWQLDTRGVGSGYTVAQLSDPSTNARITVMATANGTNWGPWETWHTGAYKKFL